MSNFDTQLFISEIQKRPSIWDTSSPQNADKALKRKEWDEIIDIFGAGNMSSTDRHLLALTLQKRWKSLRTCFARELKRQKNYGAGLGRKNEYLHYKNLIFLTDVMNISEKELTETECVYYDDDDMENPKTQTTVVFESNSKRKPSFDYEEPSSDIEEDEDRLFLLSLHKTLKRVPKNKKMAVKIKMLSVLNEITSTQ